MAISKKKTGSASAPKASASVKAPASKPVVPVAAPVVASPAAPVVKKEAPATPTLFKATKHPVKVSLEERHRMVAEAAYFIALQKGFQNSNPQENWTEAEAQIDAMLRG